MAGGHIFLIDLKKPKSASKILKLFDDNNIITVLNYNKSILDLFNFLEANNHMVIPIIDDLNHKN